MVRTIITELTYPFVAKWLSILLYKHRARSVDFFFQLHCRYPKPVSKYGINYRAGENIHHRHYS